MVLSDMLPGSGDSWQVMCSVVGVSVLVFVNADNLADSLVDVFRVAEIKR